MAPTRTVKRLFRTRRDGACRRRQPALHGPARLRHGFRFRDLTPVFKRLSNALRNGCEGPSGARRNAPAASAHPMRVASGGGFPGGGDKRPPRDGRQSPQPRQAAILVRLTATELRRRGRQWVPIRLDYAIRTHQSCAKRIRLPPDRPPTRSSLSAASESDRFPAMATAPGLAFFGLRGCPSA